MVQRLTYRRHVPWNTKSNKNRIVKTPGGKLVYLAAKKTTKRVKCGDTGRILNGIKRRRPIEMKRLKQRQRKVSRAYGGCLSVQAVRKRIVRAFLIEEQRCVKQVLQEKEAQRKAEEAPASGADKKKKKKK